MDGNYEAQKHFTREQLAARREQGAAERLLRQEGRGHGGGLRQFLVRLFGRLGQGDEGNGDQREALAAEGKGKRKFA